MLILLYLLLWAKFPQIPVHKTVSLSLLSFPLLQEQVFHIDSRAESGKGRCSFNPRVNTVSVMLSESSLPLMLYFRLCNTHRTADLSTRCIVLCIHTYIPVLWSTNPTRLIGDPLASGRTPTVRLWCPLNPDRLPGVSFLLTQPRGRCVARTSPLSDTRAPRRQRSSPALQRGTSGHKG